MWPVTYSVLPLLLIIQIFFHIGNSFDQSVEYDKLADDVEWSCKSDVTCTVEGSSCVEGRCECLPGYVYSSNMTSCLRVATIYGDTCSETIQCSRYLLTGGKCIDNACACASGFHYLHGRCYETIELGGECESDENCHINHEFGSTICDNGICKCRTGFYKREYRSCRPAALNVDEQCLINIDCKIDENAVCKKFKCTLEENGQRYRTSNVSHELPDMKSYDETVSSQWSDCTKDSDCEIHGKAICGSSGKCVCQRAHFVPPETNAKLCVPELGEPCETHDTASIVDSICQNGIWKCNFKKVASTSNQNCLKVTRTFNTSCQQDEHCYAFGPDAICNNKRCLCNENSHFIEEQQFCWTNRRVGDSCKANEDCYLEGSSSTLVCTNNVCDCPEGTHLNSKGTACINSKAELGEFCESDERCIISNSVCKDNACTCNETYYEIRKQCYPGINATCNVNSPKPNECQPRYSTCSSGVCACKKGYVAESTSTCLQEKKYGEVCTHDVQCNGETPDAICATNSSYPSSMKFCTCSEDSQFRLNECLRKKLLGESCMSKAECYLDSDKNRAICMNGICTCDWPYVQVSHTLCQKNLIGRMFLSNDATETFSRTCSAILSISLILLLDLIR